MAVEFYIHKMSEHMDAAEIIQWLAREGDTVAEHQPIIEVMTDKFTVELEAPQAGILAGIRPGCVVGATVPVGEAIAFIVQPGEQAPKLPPFLGAPVANGADAGATATEAAVGRSGFLPDTAAAPAAPEPIGRVKSTPVARRMAKALGVDIERLRGTGPGGRVTEADVRAATQPAAVPGPVRGPGLPPAVAEPDRRAGLQPAVLSVAPEPSVALLAADTAFTWQDLTPIQRVTGERMRESILSAPQFALELSADATNLLWLQAALADRVALQARARLTLTGLLVKLVAATLKQHPRVNAAFADGRVKRFHAINVGVAVGTEQGLVVPVIHDAAAKPLAAVTAELATFQEQARTLHFKPEDLADGTFTLSNLGMFGIERFTSILNPPQAAILAVGAVVRRPVVLANDQLGVKPLVNLSLTVDHRVLDGVQAARFLAELKQRAETPYFLIE